jgi:hypothetical protein
MNDTLSTDWHVILIVISAVIAIVSLAASILLKDK